MRNFVIFHRIRSNNRRLRRKYEKKDRSRLFYLLTGIAVSALITVPMFFIIALALRITDFPEEYLSPALLITSASSITVASFYSTASSSTKGWLNGSIIGFVYMFVIVIIRWCAEGAVSISKDTITMLLVGLLMGSIFGMAGLNASSLVAKYKNRKK